MNEAILCGIKIYLAIVSGVLYFGKFAQMFLADFFAKPVLDRWPYPVLSFTNPPCLQFP